MRTRARVKCRRNMPPGAIKKRESAERTQLTQHVPDAPGHSLFSPPGSGSRGGIRSAAAGRMPPMVRVVAFALIVVLLVALESVVGLSILLIEGSAALLVMSGAALAGGWLVRLVGLHREPLAERLIVGSALGVGTLSLITLGLGAAGLLTRTSAIGLAGGLCVAGLVRLAIDLRPFVGRKPDPSRPADPMVWLWLLATPFAVVLVLSASLPPGILWQEEAGGYDILEYHLAVPKTFHDRGRITFLPTNVYGNFPMNYEMLALDVMTLNGDAIAAAFMAKAVNVGLAALFVAAAWLAGRTFSPRAGVVAGVLAGTLPWVTYLAGIAYVEIGMLATGMTALAATLRAGRSVTPRRWYALAGLLAGLACGFKYPAVPSILLPVAAVALIQRHRLTMRLTGAALVLACGLMSFSPWLIRNAVNTGNPVFPLGYSVFGAKGGTWDAELDARWQRAHGAPDQPWTASARTAWGYTIGDFRMGPFLIGLAVLGAATRRDRVTLAMAIVLMIQLVVWLGFTHHYARFAVVMILPLIVLASRAIDDGRAAVRRVVCGVLIVAAGWQLYRLGGLYYDHTRVDDEPIDAYGRLAWFVDGTVPGVGHFGAINRLDPSANVMLVGEARTYYLRRPVEYAVVFNHHPLAETARRSREPGAIIQRLRDRGTTHLLVHWDEIARLSRTYGYEPDLDADLFASLVEAGMTEVESFVLPGRTLPYATLLAVPPS